MNGSSKTYTLSNYSNRISDGEAITILSQSLDMSGYLQYKIEIVVSGSCSWSNSNRSMTNRLEISTAESNAIATVSSNWTSSISSTLTSYNASIISSTVSNANTNQLTIFWDGYVHSNYSGTFTFNGTIKVKIYGKVSW